MRRLIAGQAEVPIVCVNAYAAWPGVRLTGGS
jgi:hypothetical protein